MPLISLRQGAPPFRKAPGLLIIGMVVLLDLSKPRIGPAATISFNPAFYLAQSYTTNALFTSGDEISDSFTTVGVAFPVSRTTKRSETQLIYRPAYQFYNSADELDNLSHELRLITSSRPGRSGTVDLQLRYYYGQDQGSANSTNGADLTLVPRSTREEGSAGLGFGSRISGHWRWRATANYESLAYSQIQDENMGTPEPVLPPERSSIGAAGLITYDLSSSSFAGFEVEVSQFDIDIIGKEDVEELSFVYEKSGSQVSTFSLSVGGYRSTLDPEVPLPPSVDLTQTGFQGGFSYKRKFRTFGYTILGWHKPTFGYDSIGTSNYTYLQLLIDKAFSRRLDGGLALRWARSTPRAEVLEELGSVDSASLGGLLSWRVHPTLLLQLAVNVLDQTGSDNSVGDVTFRDVAVFQSTFELIWSPLARKRIAQKPTGDDGPPSRK